MTQRNKTREKEIRSGGSQLSLDAWAVALALGLSLLIWIGWIKHVPW
jgi:hypothetical protein